VWVCSSPRRTTCGSQELVLDTKRLTGVEATRPFVKICDDDQLFSPLNAPLTRPLGECNVGYRDLWMLKAYLGLGRRKPTGSGKRSRVESTVGSPPTFNYDQDRFCPDQGRPPTRSRGLKESMREAEE